MISPTVARRAMLLVSQRSPARLEASGRWLGSRSHRPADDGPPALSDPSQRRLVAITPKIADMALFVTASHSNCPVPAKPPRCGCHAELRRVRKRRQRERGRTNVVGYVPCGSTRFWRALNSRPRVMSRPCCCRTVRAKSRRAAPRNMPPVPVGPVQASNAMSLSKTAG
jgi:hypothetical protein